MWYFEEQVPLLKIINTIRRENINLSDMMLLVNRHSNQYKLTQDTRTKQWKLHVPLEIPQPISLGIQSEEQLINWRLQHQRLHLQCLLAKVKFSSSVTHLICASLPPALRLSYPDKNIQKTLAFYLPQAGLIRKDLKLFSAVLSDILKITTHLRLEQRLVHITGSRLRNCRIGQAIVSGKSRQMCDWLFCIFEIPAKRDPVAFLPGGTYHRLLTEILFPAFLLKKYSPVIQIQSAASTAHLNTGHALPIRIS